MEMRLTFEEAVFGTKKTIKLNVAENCDDCKDVVDTAKQRALIVMVVVKLQLNSEPCLEPS